MIKITKENLIELIRKCVKDRKTKFYYDYLHSPVGVAFNLRPIYSKRNRYVMYHNKDDDEIRDTSTIKYEKIEGETTYEKIYGFSLSFPDEPPLLITNVCTPLETIKKEVPATSGLFKRKRKVFVSVIDYKIEYFIVCGTHRFNLTQSEAKDLYDLVNNERFARIKKGEDDEIISRLIKYRIV